MKKQPLDYQSGTRGEDRAPQVGLQTIISCSLLGLAVVCGVVALVWAQRRFELLAAAASLGFTGVIIHIPYLRM